MPMISLDHLRLLIVGAVTALPYVLICIFVLAPLLGVSGRAPLSPEEAIVTTPGPVDVTVRALALPEGFQATDATLGGDHVLVLGRTLPGERAMIVFDRAGAMVRTITIPLAEDWQVETFANLEEGGLLLAGRQPDGVFLARIDSPGQLAWARLEPASSRAPDGIDLVVSDGLIHLLWSAPNARQHSLGAYDLDGTRLWRRPLPGLAEGEGFLSVSPFGTAMTLTHVSAGAETRRGQLIHHSLTRGFDRQSLRPASTSYSALGLAADELGTFVVLEAFDGRIHLLVRGKEGNESQFLPASLDFGEGSLLALSSGRLALTLGNTPQRIVHIPLQTEGEVVFAEARLPRPVNALGFIKGEGTGRLHAISLADPAAPQIFEWNWPERLPVAETAPSFAGLEAPRPQTTIELRQDKHLAQLQPATPSATPVQRALIPETERSETRASGQAGAEDADITAEPVPQPPMPAPSPPQTVPADRDVPAPEPAAGTPDEELQTSGSQEMVCTFTCTPEGVPAARYPIEAGVSVASIANQKELLDFLHKSQLRACGESGGVPAENIGPVCR